MTAETETLKATLEQTGLDIKYTTDYKAYKARVDFLTTNMQKVYSIIIGTYCTNGMRTRISLLPTFKTTIMDNPIELLKVIKQCQAKPVSSQYPLITPVAHLKTFLIETQHHGEELVGHLHEERGVGDLALVTADGGALDGDEGADVDDVGELGLGGTERVAVVGRAVRVPVLAVGAAAVAGLLGHLEEAHHLVAVHRALEDMVHPMVRKLSDQTSGHIRQRLVDFAMQAVLDAALQFHEGRFGR